MTIREPHDFYQDRLDAEGALSDILDALPESTMYYDFLRAKGEVINLFRIHFETYKVDTDSTSWYSAFFTFAFGVFDSHIKPYVEFIREKEGVNESEVDLCWFIENLSQESGDLLHAGAYLSQVAAILEGIKDDAIDQYEGGE
jgi:hypothetical protein